MCQFMMRLFLRRYRSCILVVACLYLGTCVWLMMSLQHQAARPLLQRIFERVFDPFESITNRRCPVHHDRDADVINDINAAMAPVSRHAETNVCDINDVDEWPPKINIDELWETVSVGYPNMVLSVTGWVETVQVKTWTTKPLHVIIMPYSHQDPGWKESVDHYYAHRTKPTLNLLVHKLLDYPGRKFVWTEVVFLERWWNEAPKETRTKFKKLLINGQLELLTGGWVMTDESVAHYGAMLDQLTEGQQWIEDTFGMTVDSGWAIDPFGHSSTMAYILSESGVHNNIIQRAHFAIKRHLAQNKWLEFYWKQYWDEHGRHRVLTHMMPFMSYGIPFSCGPDRSVCCQFDFYNKQCFYGNNHAEKVKVDEFNVAKLAYEFWEQLQKKSELFKNNVLLVPHGDDFRYDRDDEWDVQYGYLGKIMSYINQHKNLNMKIEFGTVNDYFKAISSNKLHNALPTLSGDLFPYTDRGDQYWSGFYSTRPFYKYIVRKLQALLRSAEIFFTFSLTKVSVDTSMVKLYGQLQAARRGLALHQHHDAITGTSTDLVMKDYGLRLNAAIKNSQAVLQAATARIIQTKLGDMNRKPDQGNTKNVTLANTVNVKLEHEDSYPHPEKLPHRVVLKVGRSNATVVVTNSLGYRRREVIHVLISNSAVIVTDGQDVLRHQISPVWVTNEKYDNGEFLLSFEVVIGPLSINTYFVNMTDSSLAQLNVADIFNVTQTDIRQTVKSPPFKIVHERRINLIFSNEYLTAYFSPCDGMLKSLHYNGEETHQKADVHFVVYTTGKRSHPFKDKSGAYTFIPDGPAKELNKSDPGIIVVRGILFTEVKAIYPGIVHTATIYDVRGSYGMGVHLNNVINISSATWNNAELVMRVETDVRNEQHSFCTDVNGFQYHKRKTHAKMTIQGNFYPVTTMAALDGKDTRFTLFTTSSHGMASLVSGWMEAVLDRRLMQDDWRGLDQGVTDNIPTRSSFFIMFERKQQPTALKEHICLPSWMADHHSESLNNPLIALLPATSSNSVSVWNPLKIMLANAFPCDLSLVNLRMLPLEENMKMKQTLLVLHRKGLDCRFEQRCSNKELWMSDLTSIQVKSLRETTITGTRQGKDQIDRGKFDVPTMNMKTFKIGFS